MLRSLLRVDKVKVCWHTTLKRHIDFLISTDEAYEYEQPTTIAHIDTTLAETNEEIMRHYGDNAPRYLARSSFQWIK